MNFLEYTTEIIIILFLYVLSEYVLLPKIIGPLSSSFKKTWTQYLIVVTSTISDTNEDDEIEAKEDVLYNDHQPNVFQSSNYTLTAMTPISGSSSVLADSSFTSTPFTSSPDLISRFLDAYDCFSEEGSPYEMKTPKRNSLASFYYDINGNSASLLYSSQTSSFISSPSKVDRFLDKCEAERQCNCHFDECEAKRECGDPFHGLVPSLRDLERLSAYLCVDKPVSRRVMQMAPSSQQERYGSYSPLPRRVHQLRGQRY